MVEARKTSPNKYVFLKVKLHDVQTVTLFISFAVLALNDWSKEDFLQHIYILKTACSMKTQATGLLV